MFERIGRARERSTNNDLPHRSTADGPRPIANPWKHAQICRRAGL